MICSSETLEKNRMAAERDVLISILKLTNDGPIAEEVVAEDVNVPVSVTNKLLRGFREIGLIAGEDGVIEVSSNQRVKLAIHAIILGTDMERACKVLEWKEFENFAAAAFEVNNFDVKRRFRFKAARRKWEIDVLAYSEPYIVCVDCKRWRRGWGKSAIKRIVEAQTLRTKVLAEVLPSLQKKIQLNGWTIATLLPVIISLFPGPAKFFENVPVVPILQLQNFIDKLPGHLSTLMHFQATLGPKLPNYFNNES
jgi:Holliday junction resolvase-like predicted endonuclease